MSQFANIYCEEGGSAVPDYALRDGGGIGKGKKTGRVNEGDKPGRTPRTKVIINQGTPTLRGSIERLLLCAYMW